MKYWGFLAGKLLALALILSGLWIGISKLPAALFMLAVGVLLPVAGALLYACLWDQKYRCRVCLRRVRMPIRVGSWGQMLQRGRPRIDYICPYGHGTLEVPELQISGMEPPDWKKHGNIWEELEDLEESHK